MNSRRPQTGQRKQPGSAMDIPLRVQAQVPELGCYLASEILTSGYELLISYVRLCYTATSVVVNH